jgi:molybdopterin-guanine dinucleotide biosynthesis protein A
VFRRAALGVVVAGGRGRRLGGAEPKAMARLAGATLLERAIATLRPSCDEIVVAAPPGCPLALPTGAGIRRVADVPGFCGPLAGLVAGLEASPGSDAIVLGVDFPLLPAAAVAALLERLPGRRAVLPAPGGVPQPLAAAYAGGAAPALGKRLRAGERSVTTAALTLEPLVIGDAELATWEGGLASFLNLNTPGDWSRAEARLAGPAPRREMA